MVVAEVGAAVVAGRVAVSLVGCRVASVVFCAGGGAAGVVFATDDLLAKQH